MHYNILNMCVGLFSSSTLESCHAVSQAAHIQKLRDLFHHLNRTNNDEDAWDSVVPMHRQLGTIRRVCVLPQLLLAILTRPTSTIFDDTKS